MTTKLGKSDIEHVARLARLPVSSKELSTFQEQLSEITSYVGKIGEIPITKHQISNKLQIRNLKLQTVRKDEVDARRCLTQEEAVSNTKNVHNGMFVVPAIFEE